MSPLNAEDVDFGRSKGSGFFRKSSIEPGGSVTVTVVDVEKNTQTKYPITGKDWAYRFVLEDGRTWDEPTASVFGPVLKIVYPDRKTFHPAAVKVTKLANKPLRGSQYVVVKA